MKSFKQHILEKLKVSVRNTIKHTYTLFPTSKEELQEMIEDEISKNGNECSLKHIDVSRITDMSKMFDYSIFDGDISNWDVSNVTKMKYMFSYSKFNGDISNWDVSNVRYMNGMFYNSKFNGDISNWDVSGVKHMRDMFMYSPLGKNPPKWYK